MPYYPLGRIFLLLLGAVLAEGQGTSTNYWPAAEWRTSSPERQGVNSRDLARIFGTVRARQIPIHSLIVIRNGYLVLEAYFHPFSTGNVHDLASVTKSVMSTLIGIAIDKGYIKSVDQPVLDFFPGRRSPRMDDRWKRLTVKHLLTMTSGFCEDFRSGEQQLTRMRLTQDWRAEARRGSRTGRADGESAVLATIAALPQPDRAMAERLHAIIKANPPALSPKTWYGMPAYAKDGNVVCFFQSAQKFKTRYATLGFSDQANLDEGHMWPTAFALKELTAAKEAKMGALVKKAVN